MNPTLDYTLTEILDELEEYAETVADLQLASLVSAARDGEPSAMAQCVTVWTEE